MTKEKQTLTLTFQDFMKKFRPCPDCNEFRQLQLTYIKTSCHKFDQVCAMTQPAWEAPGPFWLRTQGPNFRKWRFAWVSPRPELFFVIWLGFRQGPNFWRAWLGGCDTTGTRKA